MIAYGAAFLAGFLTSLTPCVYPMIPITAAYLGGSSRGTSRMRSFLMAVSYVLGISVMYSALGAIAALSGKIFGSWVMSPGVNIAIAVIFILLGLSMLDLFMIPLPGFLTNLSSGGQKKGYVGAFTVGVVSGLIATPCSAPVMLGILTLVARGQNVIYGISLLFVFSVGMGILLVVIGTFAGALAALPKSGRWMEFVKWFFGIAMIVCGGYFLFVAIKLMKG
ncbi:MAG TPA: cytochrome c biogenesis protein CcdA [bacterium]|nr:cytochrome c biogenesis protein CcdA [bacterium]